MHHFILRLLAIIPFLFIFCANASAQNNQFMAWSAFFNTTKLGNSAWTFQFDGQLRSTADVRNVNQILIRPALLYNFNKQHSLGMGFAFVPTRTTVSGASDLLSESRIYQQYIFKQKIKSVSVDHRFRTEERFIAKAQNINGDVERTGNKFSGRFRYFFRGIVPLVKTEEFTKGAFTAIQDEIFINILQLDNVNGKTFDQNRAYASFGYRFSKKFDAELGYMYQFIRGGNTTRQQNNHILQAAFYTRF